MGIRTNAELTRDFPVADDIDLAISVAKYDDLVVAGFLGDFGDFASLRPWLGGAVDAKAEVFAPPVAVYAGAAGTTTRYYAAVPHYPLPHGAGNAGAPLGKYLNFLSVSPPYGPPGTASGGHYDGERRVYGKHSTLTAVPLGAAALSPAIAADPTAVPPVLAKDAATVTITAPAAGVIEGVTFDIIESQVADGTGLFRLVAADVAPGAVVVDNGVGVNTYPAYGTRYVPRAHAEVGLGTDGVTPIYGPLTRA